MIKKLKFCDGCKKEKIIWKSHKGKKYCQQCWNKIKPKTSIKKKSKKLQSHDTIYSVLRKEYLLAHPFCELRFSGCTVHSVDIHHTAGRGVNYLNTKTWKASCRNCHTRGHDSMTAEEGEVLGFIIKTDKND